jgi:signal transduction histidine kinase
VLPPALAGRVHADLASEAVVHGPEEELRQLVLNLVDNSLDATEEGGEVWISTSPGAGRMTLSVRDTGMGIPPELQERVFDLFFTTKEAGRGTGVGLALAKRTVTDLGGEIALRSHPGEGTEITVILPTQRASRPASAKAGAQGDQDHR